MIFVELVLRPDVIVNSSSCTSRQTRDTLICDRELTAWSQVEDAARSVRMRLPFPFLTRMHERTNECTHTDTTRRNDRF